MTAGNARHGSRTLPAALAARAGARPEEPWLFYRQAHAWRWLSWSQVADQVARGAAVLRRSGLLREAGTRIAFADRLEPGAVAAALAIEAAGGVAVPVAAGGEAEDAQTWAVVEGGERAAGAPCVVLPAARSRLARWTPEPLVDEAAADAAGELWRAAARWRARLPEPRPGERPIVLASAGVGRAHRRVLLAWVLATAAAWVLEPDLDAFVPAALWTRPTLVVAPGSDVGLLALALRERKHRRWHRVRAVGPTDDAPREIYSADDWKELGVPVVGLTTSSSFCRAE